MTGWRRNLALVIFLASGCRAPQLALCEMPSLVVWTAEANPDGRTSSPACAAFWRDFRDESTGLSRALRQNFDVYSKDYERYKLEASWKSITPRMLPVFSVGGRRIAGYTTPQDLCVRLGLGVVETRPTEAKPRATNPVSPPPEVPFGVVADPRIDQLIEELKAQHKERDDLEQRVAIGETTAAAAASKLDRLQRGIEKLANLIADRVNTATTTETAPPTPDAPKAAAGWFDLALGAASVALPYLGIAVPGGGLAAFAVWGFRRFLNRAKRPVDPIAVSVPLAAPDHTITHIVDHSHAQAFTWACDQVLKRYPANEAVIETLKSLISQYGKDHARV